MTPPTDTHPWDAADHLESEEDIVAYLEAAFEDGDPVLIAAALGDIAKAQGRDSSTRATSEACIVTSKSNPRSGSSLDDVLESEGVQAEAAAVAAARVRVWQADKNATDQAASISVRAESSPLNGSDSETASASS